MDAGRRTAAGWRRGGRHADEEEHKRARGGGAAGTDRERARPTPRASGCGNTGDRRERTLDAGQLVLGTGQCALDAGRETLARKVFRVSRLESSVFRKLALGTNR